nr:hypothetical protein P5630_09420 [Bacillus subtilis]
MIPLKELTPDIPITTNFMADTPDLIPYQSTRLQQICKACRCHQLGRLSCLAQ